MQINVCVLDHSRLIKVGTYNFDILDRSISPETNLEMAHILKTLLIFKKYWLSIQEYVSNF